MASFKNNIAAKLLIAGLLSIFALQASATSKTELATIDLWGRDTGGWGSEGLVLKCNYHGTKNEETFSFTSSTQMTVFSDGTASISGNITRLSNGETWGLDISLGSPEIRKFSNPSEYYVDSNGNTNNGKYSYVGSSSGIVTTSRIQAILNGENTIAANGGSDPFGYKGHYFLGWDQLSLDLIDVENYGNASDLDDQIELTGWVGMKANNYHGETHVAALDYGHGFTTDFWTQHYAGYCEHCTGDHKGKGHTPSTGVPIPTTAALLGLGLLALGRRRYQAVK